MKLIDGVGDKLVLDGLKSANDTVNKTICTQGVVLSVWDIGAAVRTEEDAALMVCVKFNFNYHINRYIINMRHPM